MKEKTTKNVKKTAAFRLPIETINKLDAYSEKVSKKMGVEISRAMALQMLVNIGFEKERENA